MFGFKSLTGHDHKMQSGMESCPALPAERSLHLLSVMILQFFSIKKEEAVLTSSPSTSVFDSLYPFSGIRYVYFLYGMIQKKLPY